MCVVAFPWRSCSFVPSHHVSSLCYTTAHPRSCHLYFVEASQHCGMDDILLDPELAPQLAKLFKDQLQQTKKAFTALKLVHTSLTCYNPLE